MREVEVGNWNHFENIGYFLKLFSAIFSLFSSLENRRKKKAINKTQFCRSENT